MAKLFFCAEFSNNRISKSEKYFLKREKIILMQVLFAQYTYILFRVERKKVSVRDCAQNYSLPNKHWKMIEFNSENFGCGCSVCICYLGLKRTCRITDMLKFSFTYRVRWHENISCVGVLREWFWITFASDNRKEGMGWNRQGWIIFHFDQ